MITIRNLQKRYGETVALKGIDLEVSKGELFAYLGPNGAGKSTTIRILTGLTRMSGGSAELAGFDIESDRHPSPHLGLDKKNPAAGDYHIAYHPPY